ncbi:ADP-ribosyltransferase [Nocardia sp. NPDC049220]|uniref:ADP-ribosyltransferase n=1 Tax=Nocardia sp. NPDC049220 TaxID=3155273 RepID=UPI0033D41D59
MESGILVVARRLAQRLGEDGKAVASAYRRFSGTFTREISDGMQRYSTMDAVGGSGVAGADTPHRRSIGPVASAELTQRDVDALVYYIKEGYGSINHGLRSGQFSAAVGARIEALRTALVKIPDYRGTVFREADIPREILSEYRRGNIVTEKAFTSARRRGGYFIEGRVKFKIKSKHAKSISAYSNKPHEKEVLFMDGTRFEVTRRRENRLTGITRISMREL